MTIGDYNDASVVLPFTNDSGAGTAFLPDGDTTFDYRLVVTGRDDEVSDTQTGSIDLAAEIVPDSASIGLDASGSTNVAVTGTGDMLWLFQNNNPNNQSKVVTVQ